MNFARKGGGSDVSTLLMMFVYGTLKRREPNHYRLTTTENGVARFLGVGKTAVKYPLVIASRYNIPFLLYVPGTGDHVEGEVFEIDHKMLSTLDTVEQYPIAYTRKVEKIILENNIEEMCWTYFLNGHKPSLLELPKLTSYSASDDHGFTYVPGNKRDPRYDFKDEVLQDYVKNKKDK